MNILIAGLGRSGSTALFNIIKEIILIENDDIYYSLDRDYIKKNEKEINIVKTHQVVDFKNWADIIITTRRDLRDVVSSFKQYHKSYNDEVTHWTKLFLEWYSIWEDISDYEFIYENFMENNEPIIIELSNVLGVKLNKDHIKKIKTHIDVLKKGKGSFMSNNHISKTKGEVNSYTKTLTQKEIDIIESVGNDWLKKHNYI